MKSDSTQPQPATGYPPFAFSEWHKPNGSICAYKVLKSKQSSTSTTSCPLVLVHGLSAVGLVDWLPLATELSKFRTVLIFDNRGIGASKVKQDEPFTMFDLAQDVIELVQHVGWNTIDLLGFSMGGMIVQSILVTPRLPFKVNHVVLAATSAKPAHSDLLQAIPKVPQGQQMNLEQKIKLVKPFVEVGYDSEFVKLHQDIIMKRVLESVHTRRPAKTVQYQVEAIAGYDIRKQMSTIPSTLPILILHGTKDRSVYFTESKYILNGLKQSKLLKYNGIGHMWYDYYTIEYWTNLLNSFLNDQTLPPLPVESIENPKSKL
ncbi:hypothetical protein OIO90_000019 [Microbotryomycetes sp. JL221]|nr:hypothetical protein OIO90_000019 [Microbotryomycetes sp. JL221]